MIQPVIFVGSSSEARTHDIQVRCYIESSDARVVNWRDGFKPGDYPLDALATLAAQADGALLIATPDDTVTSRGAEYPVPRDNILVELGYFTAALGRHRTALIYVHGGELPTPKLPTDLSGVTVVMYDPSREAANERAVCSWVESVRTAASARGFTRRQLLGMGEALATVPDSWLPYITNTLLTRVSQSVVSASRGEVDLRAGEYYRLIYQEMDSASSQTEVRAVASLSPTRWIHSEEQKGYIEKNIAAAGRGARIRRLFVLPDDVQGAVAEIARRMEDSGISIRFARPGRWPAVQRIQDMVMFSDKSAVPSRAYTAYPDADYPLRIDSAELSVAQGGCAERAALFDKLWELSADVQTSVQVVGVSRTNASSAPPGHAMKPQFLDRPVVTCSEAAAAKQIPLRTELKTLILETSIGAVAVHVPGDRAISLRSVKKALGCKQARVASRAKLSNLGLAPGTVSPVLDPVWYMPQLLCESVLASPIVSTNSGTLTGYFKFSPQVLLQAPNVILGTFSVSDTVADPIAR